MRGLTTNSPPFSKPLGIVQRQRLCPIFSGGQHSGGKSVWYVRKSVIPSAFTRSKPTQRLALVSRTTKSNSTHTSGSLASVPLGSPFGESTLTAVSLSSALPGADSGLHTFRPFEG